MTLTSWLPLSLVGLLSWGGWTLRQFVGSFYRPATNDHRESTSLVVPVYREDVLVLERSLATWLRGNPDEVILVIDHSEVETIEHVSRWLADDARLRMLVVRKPGKRHALCVGIRAARHDVVVLTDSDTFWADDLLANLLMGFAERRVGGVACRQNVLEPHTSSWRRAADWMLDVRFLHFLPATARLRAVPCISGRTAAYRSEAVLPVLDQLEFETFWGRHCISGDDGRLTWLVLQSGWLTAYQSSARAWTVFPNTLSGFVKQRVRWSRNSYRCYFRAAWTGWLWDQPLITTLSIAQNLIGPFILVIPVALVAIGIAEGRYAFAGAIAVWLVVGRALKGFRHLRRDPSALLYVPFMTCVFIVVMIPIKVYALLTLNRQGWVTRTADGAVAEGQSSTTLSSSFGLDRRTST